MNGSGTFCIALLPWWVGCAQHASSAIDDNRDGEAGGRVPAGARGLAAKPNSVSAVASNGADAAARPPGDEPATTTDAGPRGTASFPRATRLSLIDHERWTPLEPEDDPFPDRPPDIACEPEALAAEMLSGEFVYGVDTGRCNYLAARQPSQTRVVAGETVRVRLWHFELSAPEPAEAHAALDLGDIRVLDERLAIPAAGALIDVELVVNRGIPAGVPVHFHLHNHGSNTWALVELSTGL